MDFNSAQLEAIRHKNGPMMVLAGPGSGKTTVLTERLKYLTEKAGVSPESILVITFTAAAADEMEKRYIKKSGDNSGSISFGTFHSIFFKILMKHSSYTHSSIADGSKKREILKELISRKEKALSGGNELLEAILSEISYIKNLGEDPNTLCEDSFSSMKKGEFLKLYSDYNRILSETGRLDFDDMLLKCREMFRKRPDILEYWRKKYRYILVDEFQDINGIQYDTVKLLAAPSNNLFIVGDDDQSIYSFRGARPGIMLNFPKDYPGCERVLLASNYRSSSDIVESSLKLISHNKNRYKKQLVSHRGRLKPVNIAGFDSEDEEIRFIIKELKSYIASGRKLSDICILYRTNRTPEKLCSRLIKEGIGFSLKEKSLNIFESCQAADIFAYLGLAENISLLKRGIRKEVSVSDFLRIMNRPLRYISRDAVMNADRKDINSFFKTLSGFYGKRTDMRQAIRKLYAELSELSVLRPEKAIEFINKRIGYEDWLISSSKEKDKSALMDSLDSLSAHAEGIKSFRDLKAYREEYGRALKEAASEKKEKDKNFVNFMTFHASKGLEFDIVYIINAIEGIAPYKRAESPEAIEEERRMFYVAMTRARNVLHIFYTKNHYNKPCKKSRFVSEITEERFRLPWKNLRF